MSSSPDDDADPPAGEGSLALARALAAARPGVADDPARALRRRAALAAVLGGDDALPRVGPYRVEARVGGGGMGVVYRALDPDGRRVALKVLRGDAARERSRFRREAELLRGIVHPHVVRYLDHGVSDEGLDYLVMEWLVGRDLAARIAAAPVAVDEALRVALAAADALRASHEAGVIHRDVKPGNVFLVGAAGDDVRLLDFGIAKADQPAHATLTATGVLLGSPQFMAPEQLRGGHDARTDVYGLGATLFNALTGRAPFVGAHPAAVLLAVATASPPSARSLRPEVSPALDAMVARMLAKDPRDRPRDMTAVLLELSDLRARPAHRPAAPAVSFEERERRPQPRRTTPDPARHEAAVPIGRARAFAFVLGACEGCAEDERAAWVALTGNAGAGKSHLLSAVAAELRARGWIVRLSRGHDDERGAPFAALRALPSDDDPHRVDEAAPLAAALAKPPQRAGERVDAWADAVRLGLLELLDAWTRRAPVALLLDDAWTLDAASLRAIDRALTLLASRTLVVIAATRRAPDSLGLGGELPADCGTVVPLGPLGPTAAARLASMWRPSASGAEVSELVSLAAGDPSLLRALCTAPPEAPRNASLAELVWVRLGALDPEVRRVLRAGAVVGRGFSRSVLAALLDVPEGDPRLVDGLRALRAAGWVREVEASGDDPRWEFDSELVQRAAYELNTPESLRRGHALVARHLQARGAGAGLVARHLSRAGQEAEAVALHLEAAATALAGGVVEEAAAQLDAASPHGSRPEHLARTEELRAQLAFWSGRVDEAVAHAVRAVDATTVGEAPWFDRLSLAVTAAGQRGDNDTVRALAARAFEAAPRDADGAEARVATLCRSFTQLATAGEVPSWLRAGALAGVAARGDVRAWVARARATDASQRSFDEAIAGFVEAHRAHLEAGDRRSAAQVGLYLGSYLVWSGAWERAREVLDDALRTASRLGADYMVTWGRYVEAKLLVEEDPGDATLRALGAVVEAARGSARIRAGAMLYASLAAHRLGRWDEAARHAAAAREESGASQIVRAAAAARCRSLVARGDVTEARSLAARLVPSPRAGSVVEFDELVMLARVEVAADDALPETLAEAVACLHARAATLADPLRRNAYLTRPHLVAATLARAPRA